MSKLVIAEKPMLARDIARAICGIEVAEDSRLPLSGNGYTVIACAGHLLELMEPDAIETKWGKPWTLEALPVYVENWPKVPSGGKDRLVDQIEGLLKEADSVVHAGDPDDEGQLIVDEVLDYFDYTGYVERVYVNDNIEKNIQRAFENLIPNDECKGTGNAAYARQMADTCFGYSETRLATKKLGACVSVGRVQTPTLGLVVTRDEQIEHHVKQVYFEFQAKGTCTDTAEEMLFKLKPAEALLAGEKHLLTPDVPQRLKESLESAHRACTTVLTTDKTYPLLPYNLTVLLADMSRRYNLSASTTQQITQDLRDKYKAITYNRTDCQYLKLEHHAQAPGVMAHAMKNLGVSWELDFSLESKAFNDKNVSAHHGIIPQEIDFDASKMTTDERNVYTAICERYAMQFLPEALYEVSTSTISLEEGDLVCMQRRLIQAGWKATFGNLEDDESVSDSPSSLWLDAGEHDMVLDECSVLEKQTAPPKPYTEGTLIADMASIVKYVTNPEIKAILKQKDEGKKGEHGGIGTTATRSAILEKLKARGFLVVEKNKIRATPLGRAFYHLLPNDINSADTTAKWWLLQQDIAEGIEDVNAIQRSVREVFEAHRESAYVGKSLATTKKVGTCPICKAGVVAYGKIASCETNKSEKQEDGTYKQIAGCGFKVYRTIAGKKLTDAQITALLEKGKTPELSGFKSKSGSTFSASLVLKPDNTVGFEFKPKGKAKKSSGFGKF